MHKNKTLELNELEIQEKVEKYARKHVNDGKELQNCEVANAWDIGENIGHLMAEAYQHWQHQIHIGC